MKIYIIGLIVSVLFVTGCENLDFDFSTDENDTVIVDPSLPIDGSETDDNETVDDNETLPETLNQRLKQEDIQKSGMFGL